MPKRPTRSPRRPDSDIERAALRLLALREHSRGELRRKLGACGYAAAEVGRLIEDLADRGLVSDRRMAEVYVDERVRKGFGPARTFDAKARAQRARFLEYRGFPAELIADFLNGRDEF